MLRPWIRRFTMNVCLVTLKKQRITREELKRQPETLEYGQLQSW